MSMLANSKAARSALAKGVVRSLKGKKQMNKNDLKPNPFAIGDIVYVIGKYLPSDDAPLLLLECKISHIEHRQFVAFRTDGETGVWRFSRKDYNKCVFTDKTKATEEWYRRTQDGRRDSK